MQHSDTFLSKLLKHQSLDNTSPEVASLIAEGTKIKELIDAKFGAGSAIYRDGGSKEKGTMIRCAYDYDLSVYSENGSSKLGETLDDMADGVRKCLEKEYTVKEKTVALQLLTKVKDEDGGRIGVDVVVGRYVDTTRTDAFLAYRGSEKERLKTNLDTHIQHVKNSGCVDIIRLMKIWKVARGLDEIRTFPLELATIKVLKETDAPSSGLSQRLYWVLDRLGVIAESMGIEDLANPSGNNIDRFFGATERKMLRKEAEKGALNAATQGWEKLFAGIDTGEKASNSALLRVGLGTVTPIKPWSG